MSEPCPLAGIDAFYSGENIPEICRETCEALWNAAVNSRKSDHEEYPDSFLAEPDCPHPITEFGGDSLQSGKENPPLRYYTTTEHCLSCDDEIAEDSYQFDCPNS